MSKSKEKIRVSFLNSGAAEDVTGSCTLITWGKPQKQLLVDCGLIQGDYSLLKEYQLNNSKFSFKEKNINYIFLTHPHIDHHGKVPLLVKRGFSGKIIIPQKSKEIIKALELDSAKIMERDALDLQKKFKREFNPIYEELDVYKALDLMQEFPIGEKIKLDDDLSFELVNSGHTLGSCQIILYIKNNNNIKKIAFTGDLGNLSVDRLYTNSFSPVQNANLLIGEVTYCNQQRSIKAKDRKKDLEKIKSAINILKLQGKGNILIPCFSFMRSQVMMSILYDLFKNDEDFNFQVVVASPLICKINSIFSDVLEAEELRKWEEIKSWDKFIFIDNFLELENVLKNKSSKIYIASAGMMNSGYSVWLGEKFLPHQENIIMFCGFSTEGSLAQKIKSKKTKTIKINGKNIPSKCNVINLHSFSSHIQYEDMLKYYSGGMGTGTFEKIALQHGNFKDKVVFSKVLQEEISKRNRTDKVICVNKSTEILL